MTTEVELNSSYFNLTNSSPANTTDYKKDNFINGKSPDFDLELNTELQDPDVTIEIELDDDIVFIEPELIEIEVDEPNLEEEELDDIQPHVEPVSSLEQYTILPMIEEDDDISDESKKEEPKENELLSPDIDIPVIGISPLKRVDPQGKFEGFFDDANPTSPHKKVSYPTNKFDIFGLDDDGDNDGFFENKAKTKKIDKLVSELGIKSNDDYEIDSKVRANDRSFDRRNPHYSIPKDSLDASLNIYLSSKSSRVRSANNAIFRPSNSTLRSLIDSHPPHNHHDKENFIPLSDPVKKDPITKKPMRTNFQPTQKSANDPSGVFFKPPKRINKSNHPSSIPVLKPLSNLTNLKNDSKSKMMVKKIDLVLKSEANRSPKRVCTPTTAKKIIPYKPSIKFTDKINLIVDSSNGSIFDATRFATELNSINGKNVPLPETINEIVNIPTNDEKSSKKMAIIKGINNKFSFSNNQCIPETNPSGFYNEEAFNKYILDTKNKSISNDDIEVISEVGTSKRKTRSTKNGEKRKRVKWANDLEW